MRGRVGTRRTLVGRDGPEPRLQLLDHAGAPVDHGSEDVEEEGLYPCEGVCCQCGRHESRPAVQRRVRSPPYIYAYRHATWIEFAIVWLSGARGD